MFDDPTKFIYFAIAFMVLMRVIRRLQRWKPFDNQWLLDLALDQRPDDIELHDAIKNLDRLNNDTFIEISRKERNSDVYKIVDTVVLNDKEVGEVHLKRIADGRIKLLDFPTYVEKK